MAFFVAPNFSFAQTGNSADSRAKMDSINKARKDALEAQRIERQRVLDSTTKARTRILDSTKKSRQRILDSTRDARKHILDSTRAERTRILDSMKQVREHRADSLTAVREYRSSKRFKDSVTKIRTDKIAEQRAVQKAHFDSIKAERKRILDSTTAVRKQHIDSVRAEQKRRTDSLAKIREYRSSKRYKDSVAIIRQGRLDSIRVARKEYNDSVTAVRKQKIDSMTAARRHITDSVTAARKVYMDSLKTVRQVRADSLAKVRAEREEQRKAMAKKREADTKKKYEDKIEKEREAWSNEKMLKKKWSLPRKAIQNTFTRYNYYFNADRRMDEALANMLRVSNDNYDSLLALFPFDPNRDSTVLAPDMDSIIKKASVAIQIHDPRTKWGDDMYLLLGQANYYKGNYEQAALSFRYAVTIKEQLKKYMNEKKDKGAGRTRGVTIAEEDKDGTLDFLKHQSVHNEALLWLTRTYTQSGDVEMAESVLDLIAADPKFPEKLKGRLALERAFLNLKAKQYQPAQAQLAIVSADEELPDWTRMRAAYLNGQLAQNSGNYETAAKNFQSVIDLHPQIDMDFYARKNLAYSLMNAGGEQKDAIASLKSMLKDGKYTPYYDQIYFVLGMLSVNSNNSKEAITYLQKSIDAPKAKGSQKALSYAAIGNTYYQDGDYASAKMAYDSAAVLAGNAGPDPSITQAIKRSQVLDAVTKPLNTIKNNDSLLNLASLSEKEQRQVVRQYIKELEKQRADSIYRAENPTIDNDRGSRGGGRNNSYGNWYFTNMALVQKGMNDFKQKWGERKNVDNWRRSAALGFRQGSEITGASQAESNENLDENGLPTEESLLAMIPKTKEEKDATQEATRKAYRDLTEAYIKQLEDYPQAIAAMDAFDNKYPDNEFKADILYYRYLVALKQEKLDKAQEYSLELRTNYPNSKYAALIKPTAIAGAAADDKEVGNFYDYTYDLLNDRKYDEVIERVHKAQQQFNSAHYNARFSLLEVSALAGKPEYEKAEKMVVDFIATHPKDSLLGWAEALRKYITDHKPKNATPTVSAAKESLPKENTNNQLPQTPTTPNSNPGFPATSASTENITPDEYEYNPNSEHYTLIILPLMETRAVAVKAALTDYNNLRHKSDKLTTNIEVMKKGAAIIIVKKFVNATKARAYATEISSIQQIFRQYKTTDYDLMAISAKNYKKLLEDKDVEAYKKFYKNKY